MSHRLIKVRFAGVELRRTRTGVALWMLQFDELPAPSDPAALWHPLLIEARTDGQAEFVAVDWSRAYAALRLSPDEPFTAAVGRHVLATIRWVTYGDQPGRWMISRLQATQD